ncbi:TldD/PmbA family protein [Lyngbya confervoides]|uniref:Metallopeptidase TldD-related protein n=1 Tax=Lyngbya confervoides BDU141951 TaxID=1574623 RepID=A0ABD4T1C8_9CYAN|nr:metallopeptidase TldD-related protein [Lyngbya confervoides]MCM1982258.1 metallopeptidase TldD-related protein [Lyngbya confervoides BDU141951]
MSFMAIETWEASFDQLCDRLFNALAPAEHLSIELMGEQSHFMRLNAARVRQTGLVTDGKIRLTFIHDAKTATATFPFTGDLERDTRLGLDQIALLRADLPQLPDDPYLIRPQNLGSSHDAYAGTLLDPDQVADAILPTVQGLDFTGIYAAGPIVRANRNSVGQRHWFSTETFFLDYSVIAPSEKAVKSTLAGSTWQGEEFSKQIDQAKQQILVLERPMKTIAPGQHRTYLAPAALAEILTMFSWGAVSEAALRQGGSALKKLRDGQSLSPLFSLKEDFSRGTVPRFNSFGETAPEQVPLITAGELTQTLVNSRTAKEYGLESNSANLAESLRAPDVAPGHLHPAEVLSVLGTGLYLSNLHYLNWSDRPGGRITGMTRYACFWVEAGEIVAPIQDLRFDDSLYQFLGENLEAVTQQQSFIPDVDTYDARALGGSFVPGMLIRDFTFTL